jgi:hypothetical protein
MSNINYFKPYKHPQTNQAFYEADSHKQSVFLIAGGEQKRAFPIQPSTYPDVMLSLGSGSGPERRDSTQQLSSTKKNKRRNVKTDEPRDSWHDFLSSLPANAPLDHFVRIDPIMISVPELDDLDSMNILQDMMKSLVDMDDIRSLALQLFATIFYFQPTEHRDDTADAGIIQGSYKS